MLLDKWPDSCTDPHRHRHAGNAGMAASRAMEGRSPQQARRTHHHTNDDVGLRLAGLAHDLREEARLVSDGASRYRAERLDGVVGLGNTGPGVDNGHVDDAVAPVAAARTSR